MHDVTSVHACVLTVTGLEACAALQNMLTRRRCIEVGMLLFMQDPLADGPTIQAAATRALLGQHVTLDQVCAFFGGTTAVMYHRVLLRILEVLATW